jgi:PhnB protein
MTETHAQPEVKGTLTPYLNVDGAIKAGEYYKAAFGAELVAAMEPDEQGRTYHVHLYINGNSVMLCDFYPEQGQPKQDPACFNLMLTVDDVEAWWTRATAAPGMEIVMPLDNMFWGSRYGMVKDPYGILWAMSQPLNGVE